MKFYKLIKQLLNENYAANIPANDGSREVYGFNSRIRSEKFKRFNNAEISKYWDNWECVYPDSMDTFSFEYSVAERDDFFATITDLAQRYVKYYDSYFPNITTAVQDMKNNIPAELPGVYRYFGDNEEDDFWWGFEIDMVRYKMGHILDAGSEGVSEEDNILDW